MWTRAKNSFISMSTGTLIDTNNILNFKAFKLYGDVFQWSCFAFNPLQHNLTKAKPVNRYYTSCSNLPNKEYNEVLLNRLVAMGESN